MKSLYQKGRVTQHEGDNRGKNFSGGMRSGVPCPRCKRTGRVSIVTDGISNPYLRSVVGYGRRSDGTWAISAWTLWRMGTAISG